MWIKREDRYTRLKDATRNHQVGDRQYDPLPVQCPGERGGRLPKIIIGRDVLHDVKHEA